GEAESAIPKRVHALGSVASAKFIVTQETKFTGLFQKTGKAVPILVRFSLANPVWTKDQSKFALSPLEEAHRITQIQGLEFIPGVAIKFFFDNKPSEDLVAMDSLAGQFTSSGAPDRRYFAKPFMTNFTAHSPLDPKEGYAAIYNRDPQN